MGEGNLFKLELKRYPYPYGHRAAVKAIAGLKTDFKTAWTVAESKSLPPLLTTTPSSACLRYLCRLPLLPLILWPSFSLRRDTPGNLCYEFGKPGYFKNGTYDENPPSPAVPSSKFRRARLFGFFRNRRSLYGLLSLGAPAGVVSYGP